MTEVENKNNNIQMGVIIALLIVIAVMGFFLGKNSNTDTVVTEITTKVETVETQTEGSDTTKVETNFEELSITIYEDKRCTNCPTDQILEQFKVLPSTASATIVRKDFSEEGVAKYIEENNVVALPYFVFSTNNFDTTKDPVQNGPDGKPAPGISNFLQAIASGGFNLEVGSTFDPFAKRSDRGFLLLDTAELKTIKENSYIKGDANSKVTWIEYSDLECPYCAKLHNEGTVEDLEKKYGTDLNIAFNHFPLGFHNNAQPGAEILECLGEQKGSDAFYSLVKKAYKDEKSNKSYLIEEAVALGANEADLNKCLEDATYSEKVKSQMAVGGQLFKVTGTPGNVLINNETGEYEVLSGAYPTNAFEAIIDNLLK